jgi:Holliday junction resolvasome RuvABC DNA-binding subunit
MEAQIADSEFEEAIASNDTEYLSRICEINDKFYS